jgi:hypothetical protein
MADDPSKPTPGPSPSGTYASQATPPVGYATPPAGEPAVPPPPLPPPPAGPGEESGRDRDRGISDLFRRAVAVGLEAAGRSKDDFVRIASTEVRGWLDHLELDTELRKALSKMVLEVKAEIRFRENDSGQLAADTETELHVRKPK